MKSVDEIIREAIAAADAAAEKSISAPQTPSDSLPHAIGCSTSGHERRIPGKAEAIAAQARAKLAPGHHAVFCSHNKLYTEPCSKCNRDKRLAERNVPIVLASLRRCV